MLTRIGRKLLIGLGVKGLAVLLIQLVVSSPRSGADYRFEGHVSRRPECYMFTRLPNTRHAPNSLMTMACRQSAISAVSQVLCDDATSCPHVLSYSGISADRPQPLRERGLTMVLILMIPRINI
jgi:hypothetical protein